MLFKTVENMYDYIFNQEKDLYNPNLKLYVWLYSQKSDNGTHDSIGVHRMTLEEAKSCAEKSKADGEQSWSAYLPAGDAVFDDEAMWEKLEELCKHDGWVDADSDYASDMRR